MLFQVQESFLTDLLQFNCLIKKPYNPKLSLKKDANNLRISNPTFY